MLWQNNISECRCSINTAVTFLNVCTGMYVTLRSDWPHYILHIREHSKRKPAKHSKCVNIKKIKNAPHAFLPRRQTMLQQGGRQIIFSANEQHLKYLLPPPPPLAPFHILILSSQPDDGSNNSTNADNGSRVFNGVPVSQGVRFPAGAAGSSTTASTATASSFRPGPFLHPSCHASSSSSSLTTAAATTTVAASTTTGAAGGTLQISSFAGSSHYSHHHPTSHFTHHPAAHPSIGPPSSLLPVERGGESFISVVLVVSYLTRECTAWSPPRRRSVPRSAARISSVTPLLRNFSTYLSSIRFLAAQLSPPSPIPTLFPLTRNIQNFENFDFHKDHS